MIGGAIRARRERKGLSVAELARLTNLSAPAVSRIEREEVGFSSKSLAALTSALDLDIHLVPAEENTAPSVVSDDAEATTEAAPRKPRLSPGARRFLRAIHEQMPSTPEAARKLVNDLRKTRPSGVGRRDGDAAVAELPEATSDEAAAIERLVDNAMWGAETAMAPPAERDRRISEMLAWLEQDWGEHNEHGRETLRRRFEAAFPEWKPGDLSLAHFDVSLDATDAPGARHVEVREAGVAAGAGAVDIDEAPLKGYLAFRRAWLDRQGIDPTQCVVISVRGESMEPVLPDGCSILLDRTRRRRLSGRIFVLLTGDGLVVKRLERGEDGWRLVSENPSVDPVPWSDEMDLVGQVRWFAKTL